MELRKAVELFLNEQRPTTRESYRYVLRAMQDWIGPARQTETLRTEQLIEYSHHLRSKYPNEATYRKHIKTMKTLFNWLVKIDVLEKSPADALKAPKPKMYISRDKAMTNDEYAALLDYFKWKPRDYALFIFMGDTGCRIGGAAGVKVSDLDLDNSRAEVTEKGDKTRPVWFGEECKLALIRWMLKRPRSAGPYFFSRDGQQLKPNNISLMIRRACKVIGIRVLSGHSLRHRKGHQFADTGVSPGVAATALGHSDPVITLRHYYPADYLSAQQAINQLSTPANMQPAVPRPIINLDDYRKTSGT